MTARFLRLRVRWVMLAYLFGFAFVAYMQRTSFSVAAERMMPDLGISQMQLGWLMTGYLVTYTACQLPAGAFGQWIGARKALFISSLLALAATIATPLAPMLFTGAALLIVLMLTRLVLGVGHAPVFPVAVGMIESWFPVGHWGFPNGLQTAGLHVGSAAATPIIAFAMQAYGWKNALLWSALPALLLILLWGWYARDQPAMHPGVSKTELAELQGNGHRAEAARITRDDLLRVLSNRDVLLLAISYTIMNYVFYLIGSWCFLYLVQERHLSVSLSGLLGSLPFIAAAIGTAVGGKWSDRLAVRYGLRIGYRTIPLIALPVAGLLLIVGVEASNPYWAVVALSLAYGVTEMTEGPYAAATTAVGRENSMAAWGVVGTGGNLGGIIGTPIVAWLSSQHAWTAAFVTGAVAAVVSGVMWLWVDAGRVVNKGWNHNGSA